MKRKIVITALSLICGLWLGVGQAAAAANPFTVKTIGARVNFYADGDTFWLKDTACDGKAAHYRTFTSDFSVDYSGTNSNGCGTTKKFAHDLPEGIQINVCAWRSGNSMFCDITNTAS